jgi:hypothetical protein
VLSRLGQEVYWLVVKAVMSGMETVMMVRTVEFALVARLIRGWWRGRWRGGLRVRVIIRVARGGIRGLLSLCEDFGCTIITGFFSQKFLPREGRFGYLLLQRRRQVKELPGSGMSIG